MKLESLTLDFASTDFASRSAVPGRIYIDSANPDDPSACLDFGDRAPVDLLDDFCVAFNKIQKARREVEGLARD
jgi:hypothetical protein